MSRLPSFSGWCRDKSTVDQYLETLDTMPIEEMDGPCLHMLADYLSQAAHNKVVSAASYALLSARRAANDKDAHEAQRQKFIAEAKMFETAARHYRRAAKLLACAGEPENFLTFKAEAKP